MMPRPKYPTTVSKLEETGLNRIWAGLSWYWAGTGWYWPGTGWKMSGLLEPSSDLISS